jgi:FkbM family methyltransferase
MIVWAVMLCRRFLERITRRFVFRRRLPAAFKHVVLYVSPAAGLRFIFTPMASIDPPLLRCAQELVKMGDVVWDVGANVGLFSLAAAVCSGDRGVVIAFEPDVWLVQLLRRTSAAQPATIAPITVVPVAVASEISLRDFSIAVRSRASNALVEYGSSQMGGVDEQHVVAAFNLDWLLTRLPIPNVIKIDVEGAEFEVLCNQWRMLNEVRPVIICEVGSQSADEVTRLLTSASYCLFDGEKPLNKTQMVCRATWSTIAIPKEKADSLGLPNMHRNDPNHLEEAARTRSEDEEGWRRDRARGSGTTPSQICRLVNA